MELNDFLQICHCPICKSDLHPKDEKSVVCTEGHIFPLTHGKIPILLVKKAITQNTADTQSDLKTSESFSEQWEMFKEGDNLWGWDTEESKKLFMNSHGLKEEDIKDKFILDLGCGHGIYSTYFAELGARVVGFDISNSFLGIQSRLNDQLKERINFMQGDVFNFPLKEHTFDFVWCSGVLHHTPDTKKAFMNVNNVVKKEGRFYLWLYKNVYYTPTLVALRKLTTKLPESVLVPLCYILAPFFSLTKFFMNITQTGYRQFEKRTLRENALSIHDTLAPPYRWHHEKEEAIEWFKEANFQNIVVSEECALGFGLYGEKL